MHGGSGERLGPFSGNVGVSGIARFIRKHGREQANRPPAASGAGEPELGRSTGRSLQDSGAVVDLRRPGTEAHEVPEPPVISPSKAPRVSASFSSLAEG